MFFRYLLMVSFFITEFSNNPFGEITCDSKSAALTKLSSYYTWWYRLINLFKTNVPCTLTDRDRKKICGQIAQACDPELKEFELEEIVDEISEIGACYKQNIHIKMEDGTYWDSKKRMYRCEAFTYLDIEVKRFYVSYGGQPNKLITFDHGGKENGRVGLAHLVSGIEVPPSSKKKKPKNESPEKENPENKKPKKKTKKDDKEDGKNDKEKNDN